jgi:HAD superfamily hydrolase (TIGR01509 family)
VPNKDQCQVSNPPPSTPGLAAVLFDMDGLLVSTEETWFAVETDLMTELGATWGPEHQEALVGGPLAHSAQYMLDLSGRSDVDRVWVETALLDGMVRRLREGPVHWMPGARELLEEVNRAGVPTGLVSSSYRTVMDAVLDAVGAQWFATTVSADDVARTKPFPDPYLAAAANLGVDPTWCVALEDSTVGSAAARAAGCVTVAVPSVAPVDPAVVDAVITSLADIDLSWLRDLVDRQPTRV